MRLGLRIADPVFDTAYPRGEDSMHALSKAASKHVSEALSLNDVGFGGVSFMPGGLSRFDIPPEMQEYQLVYN
jgi:hypothetical protein